MKTNTEMQRVTDANRIEYATAVWRYKRKPDGHAVVGWVCTVGLAVLAAGFIMGLLK